MLMFDRQAKKTIDNLLSQLQSSDPCIVWIPNGETRANMTRMQKFIPDHISFVSAFETAKDGKHRNGDHMTLAVIAMNPAALWSGWLKWRREFIDKRDLGIKQKLLTPAEYDYLSDFYKDFTAYVRQTLEEQCPGMQLIE